VLVQQPADYHLAAQFGVGLIDHLKLARAVGEQDFLARLHVPCEVGVAGAEAFGGAFDLLRCYHAFGAVLEHDRTAALEASGPNFRALEVAEYRHGAAQPEGDAADLCHKLAEVVVIGMRKIEPDDIHARPDDRLERARLPHRRAGGCHDFRSAAVAHGRLSLRVSIAGVWFDACFIATAPRWNTSTLI